MARSQTKRTSRSTKPRNPRVRVRDLTGVVLLKIFRAEANVHYLRILRRGQPEQYSEWKDAVTAAMRRVFRSIEAETRVAYSMSSAQPGPACVEGESRVESWTDAQGNTYTRTCTQYWCDDGNGNMVPDGETCGDWRPANPAYAEIPPPPPDGGVHGGTAAPRVTSEAGARPRKRAPRRRDGKDGRS